MFFKKVSFIRRLVNIKLFDLLRPQLILNKNEPETGDKSKPLWLLLCPPVIFALVNLSLRTSGLFPHSTGDELAWLKLLSLREEGYSPPISGPLFVWIIEIMAETIPWPNETVLSSAGMMFGSLSIFVVYYSYARYEGCGHSDVIALLFLISTSYFLAPAMEARPQQLGSILLFVTMLRHLSDKYKSPDYWTIILLVTLLYVHLFSMVVCSISLFLLAYTRWLSKELPDSKLCFWALILSLILSSVWIIPGYGTLLLDIFKHHLLVQTTINFSLVFMGLASLFIFSLGLRQRYPFVLKIMRLCRERKYLMLVMVLITIIVTVYWQALILPQESFKYYEGSSVRFIFWQFGNGIFLVSFLFGANRCLENTNKYNIFLRGATLLGIIGILFLAISPFVLNKNWMIRVVYYWVLFAAPVCALGAVHLVRSKKWLFLTILPIALTTSLMHVTRISW